MEKKKTNKRVKKTVKDMPSNELLSNYWLRVPKRYTALFAECGVTANKVRIVSQWFNGIWVKIDDTDQIHPISGFYNFSDILEWEIMQ